MKARLVPLIFEEANERERREYAEQMARLQEFYGGVADFTETVTVGRPLPQADAIVFPQLLGSSVPAPERVVRL